MKNLIYAIFLMLFVSSCASIRVNSDFDKTATFSAYKTYAFTPEVLSLNVNELVRKKITGSIEHELALKGLTKSDKPDVFIDLKITTKDLQSASATTMYGPTYRYHWGRGFSTTEINVNTFTEGTLIIDMIDASKKQLVWQGRGIGTIDPDLSPEKREKEISSAVSKIFTKYPPSIK